MSDVRRHVKITEGGVWLSRKATGDVLGLLDDPRRLAALSVLGSATASTIGLLGRSAPGPNRGAMWPGGSHFGDDPFLDCSAAAHRLRCSAGHVRRLAAAGRLLRPAEPYPPEPTEGFIMTRSQ